MSSNDQLLVDPPRVEHHVARPSRRPWRGGLGLLALAALTVGLVAGCSDDDDGDETREEIEEDVRDALDDAEERFDDMVTDVEGAIDDASARALAEAFAAAVRIDDDAAEEGAASLDVIEENIDDLPGRPEVTGIEDADRDGRDDDGLIGFVVDEDESCVELSPDSGEASVLDGPCDEQ